MRSLLFAPGDSPRKLDKAFGCGADCVILDLEDSVALPAKQTAREVATNFLATARSAERRPLLYVRINALDTGLADADLDSVMRQRPDGIMLPKCASGAHVQHLGAKLAVREAEYGALDGSTAIIAIATETAAAIFGMGSYAGSSRRLAGLTWGAEDLSADLGAETNRLADGGYAPPYQLARSMTLFAAAAAETQAIDTVYPNFRDSAGFRAECLAARRDGFTAKMAIHPDQVAIINEVFTPSGAEVARARAIVAAFAANPTAGVLGVDGEMLDRPHLKRAERLLARFAD
ncbi:MAG: CoA ester lyase [Methylobacteriaceae bacterium]|nr:CoA ester lyase [Methylobacteriaceae bacterium]